MDAGSVDLATIPTALVKRVEIITGGASAVYGSDAITGAVNFVLRDDFEGFQVAAQFGQTSESDGRSVQLRRDVRHQPRTRIAATSLSSRRTPRAIR